MSRSRAAAVLLPSTLVAETALAAPPTVGMADLSGVILSLVLVVGFIFAAAWVVRRMPLGIGRGNDEAQIDAAVAQIAEAVAAQGKSSPAISRARAD